jgi:hypothetical protein
MSIVKVHNTIPTDLSISVPRAKKATTTTEYIYNESI